MTRGRVCASALVGAPLRRDAFLRLDQGKNIAPKRRSYKSRVAPQFYPSSETNRSALARRQEIGGAEVDQPLRDGETDGLTLHTIDGTIPQLRRALDRSLDAFFELLPGATDEDRRDFSDLHGGMIDEQWIRTSGSTYARAARPFLPPT